MEALMSRSAQASERPGFTRRFAHWWRSWNGRRRTMVDLDGCGSAEMERIARDVGVSAADLSILAGKWPDAADLLYWRMNEDQARPEGNHARRPASHARSSAGMHGLWKQTAVRARARKEPVRSGLGKILPKRHDALSIGGRASCPRQSKIDDPKNSRARPKACHRAGRLSFIGKQPRSRPIAGSAPRPDIRARSLRAMPRHR